MEYVKEVFSRKFFTSIRPELESGVGGSLPQQVRWVIEPEFGRTVAAQAFSSVVCREGSSKLI
jgi:hypothetical protein